MKKRLALLLALSPLLVEVAARLAARVDPEPLYAAAGAQRLEETLWDPEVGTRLPPGYRQRLLAPGVDVLMRADPIYGLRGPAPGPPPRWLLLGDSFVFARLVPEEQTAAAHLAARSGHTVLNAGMEAWSTRQSVARYRQLAEALDPERVILVFFEGNDYFDNIGPHPRRAPPVPQSPVPWLQRHSYAFAYYASLGMRADVARAPTVPRELEMYERGHAPPQPEITRQALAELRDLAAARGDRLTVAAAPPLVAVDDAAGARFFAAYGLRPEDLDLAAPHAYTLAMLRDLGLPACDLAPALAMPGSFNRLEGHWSLAGQARVADALFACIERG